MAGKKVPYYDGIELRRLAEERLGEKRRTAHPAEQTDEEPLRLIHELQVHQIELEMQNEELRHAMDEVAAAQEKYSDLYDFAPIGYFTLDRAGTILSVNLSGAGLLGVDRSRLNGRCFAHFVVAADRPDFSLFLAKVFASPVKEECEAALLTQGNAPLFAQMVATAAPSGRECRIAVIDITGRKQAEEALRLAQEAAATSAGGISDKRASSEKFPATIDAAPLRLEPQDKIESSMDEDREALRLSDAISGHIVRAIMYIDNNLLGRLKLDDIAREAGMSKFHFCRSFKKNVGITPMQYVLTMRLKKAMALLQEKQKSISTIAAESGFDDIGEFNKQFKKTYGLPPSAFRKP